MWRCALESLVFTSCLTRSPPATPQLHGVKHSLTQKIALRSATGTSHLKLARLPFRHIRVTAILKKMRASLLSFRTPALLSAVITANTLIW